MLQQKWYDQAYAVKARGQSSVMPIRPRNLDKGGVDAHAKVFREFHGNGQLVKPPTFKGKHYIRAEYETNNCRNESKRATNMRGELELDNWRDLGREDDIPKMKAKNLV